MVRRRPVTDLGIFAGATSGLRRPRSGLPSGRTFPAYLKEIFPIIRLRALQDWQRDIRAIPLEPEKLLFMATVCGTYFQISHPDLDKTLDDLWRWLTDKLQRKMTPDLADLVVEALSPGIRKALIARGYQRGGEGGEFVKKDGRPPEGRGAWVAAFVVAEHLQGEGVRKTRAKALGAALAGILLGHSEPHLTEFYRGWKHAPKDLIPKLAKSLSEEYELWMIQDGVRGGDPSPSREDEKAYREWRTRHKALPALLRNMGGEDVCGMVVSRISRGCWNHFGEHNKA